MSGAVFLVHASPEVEEVVPWEQQTRQSPDLVENPPLRSQLTWQGLWIPRPSFVVEPELDEQRSSVLAEENPSTRMELIDEVAEVVPEPNED